MSCVSCLTHTKRVTPHFSFLARVFFLPKRIYERKMKHSFRAIQQLLPRSVGRLTTSSLTTQQSCYRCLSSNIPMRYKSSVPNFLLHPPILVFYALLLFTLTLPYLLFFSFQAGRQFGNVHCIWASTATDIFLRPPLKSHSPRLSMPRSPSHSFLYNAYRVGVYAL